MKVPLFVPCLIMGIVLSNAFPKRFPRWPWPARTAALNGKDKDYLSAKTPDKWVMPELWHLADIAVELSDVRYRG
jgi:glutamate:Na+ symporter, ESS family